MKYLVTYKLDCGNGEVTVVETMTASEIANLYGFNDCSGYSNIRVFRINDEGMPVEMIIESWKNQLFICAQTGEVLDSATWNEH